MIVWTRLIVLASFQKTEIKFKVLKTLNCLKTADTRLVFTALMQLWDYM